MVPLSPHELAVDNLVSLITDEAIERLYDPSQVNAFLHGVYLVLTLWRPVVVVRALEDEAQALWYEAHLGRLAPEQKIERDLAHAIVLAHIVHRLAPPV